MSKSKILLSTAGGGKTTKLIERIKEINDSKVLVLSFTRSACDEIFHRSGIKAYTLHSFCMKLMKKNYLLVTNLEDIVKIFNDTSLPNDLVTDLLGRYDQYTKFNPPASADANKYNLEFIDLFNRINEDKQKNDIYFFSDILCDFLKNIDEFLPIIYDQYNHILIDEAQDLSNLQWNIVRTIIFKCFNEYGKSFFVAGDRKQVIYDFQGSSQELYDTNINLLMQLNPVIENSTQTYRFGGKIAELVSKEFSQHISTINDGEVISLHVHKDKLVDYIKNLILELLKTYKREEILVLYPRQNSTIVRIQEELIGMGSKMKVYLQGNIIVDALWNILNYSLNKNPFYKVKILQGPFIYLKEPNGYYLITSNNFIHCYWVFFDAIVRLSSNASELLSFLMSRNVYCSPLNALVLEEISKICYGSLAETLNRLPDFIYVEQPGIRFSTIHSAKGTESKVVIYLRDLLVPVNVTIKDDHFLMEKNYLEMQSSLDYVAKTRATQKLYIIHV